MARSQMKEHLANEVRPRQGALPSRLWRITVKPHIKAHLSECRLAPTKSAGEEADSTKPARGPPPQLPVPEQRADTSAETSAKWQLPATGEDSAASATTVEEPADDAPARDEAIPAVPGPVRDLIAGLLPDGEPAADERPEVESEETEQRPSTAKRTRLTRAPKTREIIARRARISQEQPRGATATSSPTCGT